MYDRVTLYTINSHNDYVHMLDDLEGRVEAEGYLDH